MTSKIAKPFLKWAGGKTQLIPAIENTLPKDLTVSPFTYVEPFVGSGAVLFWMLHNFPNMEKAVINDINEDLVNIYKTRAARPKQLISIPKFWLNNFTKIIFLGVPFGRAFRSNLFARSSQKGFPLQSLTQSAA
jgi:DNA adenine methylase